MHATRAVLASAKRGAARVSAHFFVGKKACLFSDVVSIDVRQRWVGRFGVRPTHLLELYLRGGGGSIVRYSWHFDKETAVVYAQALRRAAVRANNERR